MCTDWGTKFYYLARNIFFFAKIKELFVTVDKKNYQPKQVKMLQGKKWTTFDISNIKKEKLADGQFRFNSKDFPKAEIIDLR